MAWFADRRLTFILAALTTLLIVVSFFVSPPGIEATVAIANRTVGVMLIWATAALITDRRRLLDRLEEQAAELRATNSQLQAQAEELKVQELRTQNEELAALSVTLEQRVHERAAALRRANESLRPDAVAAIIEDNGIGMDMQTIEHSGRLGLAGMRERVEMLGGRLSIESHPGIRTTVFVEIPCVPPRQA